MAHQHLPVLGPRLLPGARSAIDVIPFGAGHERILLGPHLHRGLELMFFAEGGGTDRLGTHRFPVRAGDLLLVTPGIVHDASELTDATGWAVEFDVHAATAGTRRRLPEGDRVIGLWWANPLLTPFLVARQRASFARFSVREADQPIWRARLGAMEHELRSRRDGHQEALAAYLLITLIEVARLAGPHVAGLRQHGQDLLASVFDVIEQRFRERLSTADVAAAVGLTPGYLTTLVRERTGRTVLDWVTERRMVEARSLLLDTDLSVEQVAGAVGYGDAAYFNRRFRAQHGTSPGAWRTAARAGSG